MQHRVYGTYISCDVTNKFSLERQKRYYLPLGLKGQLLYVERSTHSCVFTFLEEYYGSVCFLETPQCKINIIIQLYLLVLLPKNSKCVYTYTRTSHKKYTYRNNNKSRILVYSVHSNMLLYASTACIYFKKVKSDFMIWNKYVMDIKALDCDDA